MIKIHLQNNKILKVFKNPLRAIGLVIAIYGTFLATTSILQGVHTSQTTEFNFLLGLIGAIYGLYLDSKYGSSQVDTRLGARTSKQSGVDGIE